jgi:hypothetical protein
VPLTGGSLTSGTITNVPSPSAASDIVPKSYVDMLVSGVSFMPEVACYTTLSGLSFTYDDDSTILVTIPTGPLVLDGYTVVAVTDRVIINTAGTLAANGIYTVDSSAVSGLNTVYTLTRVADATGSIMSAFAQGGLFYVNSGTVFGGSLFVQTSDSPAVIGTSGIVYSQYAAAKNIAAGTNIVITGNQVDVSATMTGITSITGLSDPVNPTDAATMNYVDTATGSLYTYTVSAIADAVTTSTNFATSAANDVSAAAMGTHGEYWRTPSPARTDDILYENLRAYPISVSIVCATDGTSNGRANLIVGGVTIAVIKSSAITMGTLSAVVPANATYRVTLANGASIDSWAELY